MCSCRELERQGRSGASGCKPALHFCMRQSKLTQHIPVQLSRKYIRDASGLLGYSQPRNECEQNCYDSMHAVGEHLMSFSPAVDTS